MTSETKRVTSKTTSSSTQLEEVNIDSFQSIDYTTLPNSFFLICVASRRSGKSTSCNYLLQQFQKDKKRRFDTIILISLTDAGFEGIPKGYRYTSLTALSQIMEKQKSIKEHNDEVMKKSDRIQSKICVIIDDMASGTDQDSLRNSKTLEVLSMNGRHVVRGHEDKMSLSIMVLSQSLTKLSRPIRLNSDIIMFNALPSLTEQQLVLSECFFLLDSSRRGVSYARSLYHKLVSSKDYRFIMVENYRSNKRTHTDYIKYLDAKIVKDFQFFSPYENK
jgi:hypothetical protein